MISANTNSVRVLALRKLDFHFFLNRMGYDRGDNFPFNFELNGIPFRSKSKGKLSPRSYPIQFETKWNTNFLSVHKLIEVIAIRSTRAL